MKLGKKTHYAVISLIFLGNNNQENNPIKLSKISESQGLSLMYLEKLFVHLRKEQLVISVRGPGGGYKLARDSKDINVLQIATAVKEIFSAKQCPECPNEVCKTPANSYEIDTTLSNDIPEKLNDCKHATEEFCKTYQLWNGLEITMENYLKNISLYSLLNTDCNHRHEDEDDSHPKEHEDKDDAHPKEHEDKDKDDAHTEEKE